MNNMIPWKYKSYTMDELYALANNNFEGCDLSRLHIIDENHGVSVGHLFYSDRVDNKSRNKIEINPESYNSYHQKIVMTCLESQLGKAIGWDVRRKEIAAISDFLRRFGSDLSDGNLIKRFDEYSLYLEQQTLIYDKRKKTGLTALTAAVKQQVIRNVCVEILGLHSSDNVLKIVGSSKQGQPTIPASEADLIYHLELYTSVFMQLAKFIIYSGEYPFTLKTPDEELSVFPSTVGWCLPAHKKEMYLKSTRADNMGFNFDECRLRTYDELYNFLAARSPERKPDPVKVKDRLRIARRTIDSANADNRCLSRRRLMTWAVKFYYMHFLIVTGMNDSTAAGIRFKDIEITPGGRKLKAIKLRAGGKVVTIEMQTIFIKQFNLYLKLREFILETCNADSDRLFVCFGKGGELRPFAVDGGVSSRINIMNPLVDRIPVVTSRQYRAAKGQWIATRHGAEIASFTLQHSIATNLNKYNEVPQSQADIEMTNYFDSIATRVIDATDIDTKKIIEIASGACTAKDSPHQDPSLPEVHSSFKPDCKRFEGCLFCDKYAVHANEEDMRKLMSMQFLIGRQRGFADTEASYEETMRPILERIETILSAIMKKNHNLESSFDQIKKDIFDNENLAGYWARKQEMMEETGQIA